MTPTQTGASATAPTNSSTYLHAPFSSHHPLIGSRGQRSNAFQYDVDFNIKSINSSFQSSNGASIQQISRPLASTPARG